MQNWRKWFLVWLAYLSLFFFGFVDNARGPIYPDLLKDLQLTDARGAWFFLVASAAALANNLLLSGWIRRIGPFRTTQVYSLVQAVGLVLAGLSPGYGGTLFGCGVLGTSLGGLGISVNVLVAEGAPPALRRRLLSGLHCAYGASSLLAPLLVTGLAHLGLDWRRTLLSLAMAPLFVFVASFLGSERTARAALAPAPSAGKAAGPVAGPVALRWRELAALPSAAAVALYAVICMFYVMAEIAIGTRLALFARRDWDYSLEGANTLVAGFFLGLFVGRLIFALVPLRFGSREVLAWSAALSLVFFSLGLSHSPVWLALTGLAMSVFYPCVISLINERHGPEASAGGESAAEQITSWCITLQSLGTVALHFSLGELADRYGLSRALLLGPAALAAVLLLLVFVSRGKTALEA